MSFTFKGYDTILDAFKHFGYYSVSFKDFNPEGDYQLLIRHDVDYYPENCTKLMIIEEELKFRSNFFFLLTSEFYNPLSNPLQELFEEIHLRGHHIGLHFDSDASIFKSIMNHQAIVRQILDGEFDVYSNHKPRTQGMEEYEGIHILSTYAKQFAWDSKYLTDSNREWKYGHPVDYLEQLEGEGMSGKNIQLLIHPIWYHDQDLGKKGSYLKIGTNAEQLVHKLFSKDEKDYVKKL